MVKRNHAVRSVEVSLELNEFGNMETVTVYFFFIYFYNKNIASEI